MKWPLSIPETTTRVFVSAALLSMLKEETQGHAGIDPLFQIDCLQIHGEARS